MKQVCMDLWPQGGALALPWWWGSLPLWLLLHFTVPGLVYFILMWFAVGLCFVQSKRGVICC